MLPRRTRRSVDTALCLIALCVLVRAAGAQLLFDELFGQCQAPGAVTPTAYEITPDDLSVISDELTKLLDAGADWRDARTQCTVAYFVFCLRYELPYDGDFCAAQHPENIWALIHSIQGHLPPEAALGMSNRQSELVPVVIDDDQVGEGRGAVPYEVEAIEKRAMDESITSPAEVSVGDDAIDDYALEEQTALQPVYDDTAYDYAQYDQPVDTDNDYLESPQEQPTAYVLEPIGVVDIDDGDDNGIENDYDPGMGEQVQPGPVTAIVSQVLSELPAPQATPADEQVAEYDVVPFEQDDYVPVLEPDESDEMVGDGDVTKRNGPDYDYDDDPVLLNLKEEQLLNKMLIDVMNGGQPDLTSLSNEQLDKFISYVELMQQLLDEQKNDHGGFTRGTSKRDYEDAGNFGANTNGEMALLKKDLERLGDVNQGLNRKHKIVKGDADKHRVERVEGDRVYIKLSKDLSEDREHLINLVNFLESDVANPMNMTFSDFSVSGPEISFKVTPLVSDYDEPAYYTDDFVEVDTPILPVTGVARAVYKRRSSVNKAANADIVETGVGDDTSGHVVIERNDNLLTAIVAVCLSVGSVLALVAGVYLYKQRELARTHVHRLSHDVEAAPSKAYEELCRQRMAKGHASQSGETVEPISGTGRAAPFAKDGGGGAAAEIDERHSSTSSWSEEPIASSTNMDISTGHMILAYLEEHLHNSAKLDEEWTTLALHQPDADKEDTSVGRSAENHNKNRRPDVVPYEHTRVQLKAVLDNDSTGYINASALHDADPRAPMYIATQAPLAGTTADFWQMIWEQGSVIIVNLTRLSELSHRYWPEGGSQTHGIFDVHLVSEHIWCEDYLVRSFYLKNLRTNETRTVTQFHFLTWSEGGVPPATKPLLEFRRKVNKSYRGRSSPVVVHCSDGTGRAGTYCLLDMVLTRIAKGVKEIDIAATLEHVLDQRVGLVGSKSQYEFVLTCVADEVQAILRALAQAPPAP